MVNNGFIVVDATTSHPSCHIDGSTLSHLSYWCRQRKWEAGQGGKAKVRAISLNIIQVVMAILPANKKKPCK